MVIKYDVVIVKLSKLDNIFAEVLLENLILVQFRLGRQLGGVYFVQYLLKGFS